MSNNTPKLMWLATLVLVTAPVSAQSEGTGTQVRWDIEARAHYRDSEDVRFPSPFPFQPPQIPEGQDRVWLQTVDPGTHYEVSRVNFRLTVDWGRNNSFRFKLDTIDLHDRNPTSTGSEYDIDELWYRWGVEAEPGEQVRGTSGYLKLGKVPKFERQDDRHLESYGLLSTTYNRFEDVGVELGANLGRFFYLKGSYTQGNPVFLRDPNALAGDNGTPDSLAMPPTPELNSGIVILYDTDVDRIDFNEPEVGVGVGFKVGNASGGTVLDVLGFAYERNLQDSADLDDTLYGADLDLLLGPLNAFPLPVDGRKRREVGANLWFYSGGFSFFGQYVDEEIAGMDRRGWEGEVAWEIPLGSHSFHYIAPAVRYSRLDPDFAGGAREYPASSVRWDWEKWDYGLRIGLWEGLDLTAELAENTFVVRGEDKTMDELLVTLRYRFRR